MTAPEPRVVRVPLGARSYDVVVGADLLEEAGARLAPLCPRRRAVVVADTGALAAQGGRLLPSLAGAGLEAEIIEIAPGEGSKSFAELERLCDALLAAGLERGEPVVVFGGGVVGDLAGFAAAIVKRGAPFVQIPTTLLAQVDSSVGGKTAINAKAGKNLIGAFHQPALVLADVAALDTLDPREMRAGYAEVIKYAVIADAPFFAWLDANGPRVLAGERDAQSYAVAHCVDWKARIVAEDEREAGRRALLNLGHTFGHAFEAEAGYGSDLRHGEAVGAGMVMAAAYAEALGRCPPGAADDIARLLTAADLPATPDALSGAPFDADAVLARMGHDKKNQGGRIRLVLPSAIGACELVTESEPERLRAFLRDRLS
ncbi:MAG: 3-dehydroquinate synthase [Caulobacterales bacterium]|nr:3-dehydroquinate synthase [Caulobacterales bacterium]